MKQLQQFEAILGYHFQNIDMLRLALTHSSAISMSGSGKTSQISAAKTSDNKAVADNERLEFLGDRVLGLVIAEILHTKFPYAPEGELARRYNRVVRKETCAEIAKELDLGPFLIMGEGEHDSGGRKKPTILADACEAVLGAVFLDGGYSHAQSIIHRLWSPRILAQDIAPSDPKSALQEWAQGRQLSLPKYVEVNREGPDHAPYFTTDVHINGLAPARGVGASKRASEQNAARTFLEREQIWDHKETEGSV